MLLMYECYEYRCHLALNLLKFMCNSQGPISLMLSVLQSINTDAMTRGQSNINLTWILNVFLNFIKS